MQTQQNADVLYFDGHCPACRLKEKKEDLRLNSNDFWECISCHLQLTTFAPYAAILRWPGEGKFRQTIDYAHNHYDKLILTGTCLEIGNDIFPDPREVFYDSIEIEEYIECIYNAEETYHNDQFDSNDPVLNKQEQYLETIATEEWVDLVELYKEVKEMEYNPTAFMHFTRSYMNRRSSFPSNGTNGTQDR